MEGMTIEALNKFETEINNSNAHWKSQLSEANNKDKTLMMHTHLCYPLLPQTILKYFKSIRNGAMEGLGGWNCTMMPNDLLLQPGTLPVFTIRDPRLTIPSAYRTMKLMGLEHGGGFVNFFTVTCPVWSRLLYDFYVSEGFNPLVIEADDYQTNVEFVRVLCVRLGLNPDELQLSWSAATDEQKRTIHPMYYASQSTLINSSKAEPSLAAKNIDMENRANEWPEMFKEDGVAMRELLELAKPHYEYLRERRMKA